MRWLALALVLASTSVSLAASTNMISWANGLVPAGGYILDAGGPGSFITPGVPGGKVFAR